MDARIGGKRPHKLFIREWIRYKRLDQKRLAERMGCEPGTLSKLINGRMERTENWLSIIAEGLDVSVPDLFRDPESPSPEDLLRSATPEQRRRAFVVIEALLKDAS